MRYSTALVFKKDIPKKRIEEALAKMDDIIDRSQDIPTYASRRFWGTHLSGTVLSDDDATPLLRIRVAAPLGRGPNRKEKNALPKVKPDPYLEGILAHSQE